MRTLTYIIISLWVFNCVDHDSKKILQNQIITQTIGEAIDSVTIQPDSSILIHFEFYAKRKVESLKILLEVDSSLTKQMRGLTESLLSSIDGDSVSYKFNYLKFRSNVIIEETPQTKKYYDDKRYFGTINISDPLVDESGTQACYYLAVNCSGRYPHCSVGSLIFVENTAKGWKVSKIYLLWIGGS